MSAAAAPKLVSFPAADSARENTPTLKPWQDAVIKLLAQGCSIAEAMRRVRLTEDAFYKACKRQPEFAERVKAAREVHRVQIEDAFHSSEAYARRFVDLVQRDLNAPLGLRLRAALAILNRKTGAWLPHALPSLETGPEILETLDILDKLENQCGDTETEAASYEASPGTTIVENEVLPPEEMSSRNDPTTLDTLDNLDIPDGTETADVLDELTACFGSRELAERFYALASRQDAMEAQ